MVSGQRVGLVAHPASVLSDLTHGRQALLEAGVNLVALFALEHGLEGTEEESVAVHDYQDQSTGLPVYSLYRSDTQRGESNLIELDAVLFDIQDVGSRYFSYHAALIEVLKSAASSGFRLLVLDRPNPINGIQIEGPVVEAGFESRVGVPFIPIRHSMTIGELALYFQARLNLCVDIQVVKMRAWKREFWFEDTGLPWVAPSPSLAHPSGLLLYAGTCLLEGTNLSEGRGTTLPFEVLGAPWINARSLAWDLNDLGLPGIRFRETTFKPLSGLYTGLNCHGVQLHVTDRQEFRPVFCMVEALQVIKHSYPVEFKFRDTSSEGDQPHIDLLYGSIGLRQAIEDPIELADVKFNWNLDQEGFHASCEPYLLY